MELRTLPTGSSLVTQITGDLSVTYSGALCRTAAAWHLSVRTAPDPPGLLKSTALSPPHRAHTVQHPEFFRIQTLSAIFFLVAVDWRPPHENIHGYTSVLFIPGRLAGTVAGFGSRMADGRKAGDSVKQPRDKQFMKEHSQNLLSCTVYEVALEAAE